MEIALSASPLPVRDVTGTINADARSYTLPASSCNGAAIPSKEELREICRQLVLALEEEYGAVSTSGQRLPAGTRVDISMSGASYEFPVPTQFDASVGEVVSLHVEGRESDGSVIAVEPGRLVLAVGEDFGPAIPAGAELFTDAPWLLKRLRDRLPELIGHGLGAPHVFNLEAALRPLGMGRVDVSAKSLPITFDDTERPLNEEQLRAVETAFRSPLSVIVAPPGTGKTHTLGALVEASYRAGLRVLVTGPSNAAVDLVMEQVALRLRDDPGLQDGRIVRVGAGRHADSRTSPLQIEAVAGRLLPIQGDRLARLEVRARRIAQQLSQCSALPGGERRADAAQLRRELDAIKLDIAGVRKALREFGQLLVASARIVGTTLSRVHLNAHLGMFDVVLVDECSMATVPQLFVASGLARRNVTFAGDPFQLCAPVRSTGAHAKWLRDDVFTRLGVQKLIASGDSAPYVTMLTEQRRSAEAICALQRDLWYGPALRTAPSVIARERAHPRLGFNGNAVCYVDTSPLRPQVRHPWGRTCANDVHADVIHHLLAYLDDVGEIPDHAGATPNVLVLSHYRGQVATLRDRIGGAYQGRGVRARTIHTSQGAEAPTCIVDLTLAAPLRRGSSSLLTARHPHDDGSRLLAVACSRGRSRLIIVGDFAWMREATLRGTILGRLCDHLDEAHRIALPDIMPVRRSHGLHVVR